MLDKFLAGKNPQFTPLLLCILLDVLVSTV